MKKCLSDTIFDKISAVITDAGIQAYLIGGYVRDCILDREHREKDIDIVVIGNGIEIARKVARALSPKLKINIFKNYGTAMFMYGDYQIEFVGARKESYSSDSRNPLVKPGSLEDDQKRRDFTINTLAISLHRDDYGEFLDPFNGIEDLSNKIIRTPLNPFSTFSDDPLRMMRAIRFASQLDFHIEAKTFDSIRDNAARIKIVSDERITAELNKIMLTKKPSNGLRLLFDTRLLEYIFPELHKMKGVEVLDNKAHKDNFEHTLQVVDNISANNNNLWLRWAALLHDIAKPSTKKFIEGTGWTFHGHEYTGSKMVPGIFKNLKLPMGSEMKYVKKLVNLHLRPVGLSQSEVTDSAIRRLLYEAGDDIDDLMALSEADITSKNERKVKKHLENFKLVRRKLKEIEERDHIRNFEPPVDGIEIIETFGIKPGKEVGIIKSAIKEAILDGIIPNEYEPARKFMIKKALEMDLKPVKK